MDLWGAILSCVERQITHQDFVIWFKPTSLHKQDLNAKSLQVRVPNKHFEYWLGEHYGPIIQEALAKLHLDDFKVDFVAAEEVAARQGGQSERFRKGLTQASGEEVKLNLKYTFEQFVVGFSNQFAHAAALAVAEQPSKAYNPLFLYGGVGLGKTHLMHAIGHCIQATQGERARLTYMSSEHFMNELINSIRFDKTLQFREKYRRIDVLLMDDVQFLAGKERTQEEFFHTFNGPVRCAEANRDFQRLPASRDPHAGGTAAQPFRMGADRRHPASGFRNQDGDPGQKGGVGGGVPFPEEVSFFIATNIKSNIREPGRLADSPHRL